MKIKLMKHDVFVIAEAGVNHNGKLKLAKKLCKVAKESGADAIKFQTWKTNLLLNDDVSTVGYQKNNTNENSQFKMIKKLELKFKEFQKISDYCKELDILFLSTPGDIPSADFLENLGMKIFKIGSDDLDNLPLLQHISLKQKEMIISTGMSSLKEISNTYNFLKKNNKQITFLHCTSNYPTQIKDVNLKAMLTIKDKIKTTIGYSDHTITTWIPLIAICLGAKVIEKHLTLNKSLSGPDHKTSLNPEEFSLMVSQIRDLEKNGILQDTKKMSLLISEIVGSNLSKQIKIALGSKVKKPTKSEMRVMKNIKKTIVASKKIKKNDYLSEKNIQISRAGKIGLLPKEYFNLINKKTKRDIQKQEIISYEKVS